MNQKKQWVRKLGIGVTMVGLIQGCGTQTHSEVKFPPLQPGPTDTTPFLGCQMPNQSANKWIKDANGRKRQVRYLSSDDVNYFDYGWENQVASDWSYFTKANVGESNKNLKLTVIDIRNVNGKPHYHYYANASQGRPVHLQRNENWSSTKTLGVALALHRLRYESNGRIGGTATIEGNLPIDKDMDYLNRVSSNELGGYYKALGGRKHAGLMLRNWLKIEGDTFGGFYGDQTWDRPANHLFTAPNGFSRKFRLENEEYTANYLSPLTLAEFFKRLGVGFRDQKLLPKMIDYASPRSAEELVNLAPSWTEEDLKVLFYGTVAKRGGPGKDVIGGMMYDGRRDVPQNLGGSAHLNRLTQGKWRAFAKGGSGFSSSRQASEEVVIAYVCIPGKAEFAFTAHMEGHNKVARLHKSIKKFTKTLFPEVHGLSGLEPSCRPPSRKALFEEGRGFKMQHGGLHGRNYTASLQVDTQSPRMGEYPGKFFVAHSENDISNIAFYVSGDGENISGVRYNLNWTEKQLAFTAKWNCSQWEGSFDNGENLTIY